MTPTSAEGPETFKHPNLPPLLRGVAAAPGDDPFRTAVAAARADADPGQVVYAPARDRMAAALVLAPEEPLTPALSVSLAVMLGLGDALGALAPPEVAVHYEWPGTLRLNGGACGRLRAAVPPGPPEDAPDWLVFGVEVPLAPRAATEPGWTPEETCLLAEGCGEITATALTESWARHTLYWIHRWEGDGFAPVKRAWEARAWGLRTPPESQEAAAQQAVGGGFAGLDDTGGRIVATEHGFRHDPLTVLLETALPEAVEAP